MMKRKRIPPTMPVDPALSRKPDPELIAALREQLLGIISKGDLSAASLSMAEQFSAHARALLTTLDPRSGMIDPSHQFACGPQFPSYGPYEVGFQTGNAPMVPSSSDETYGAALGRELVAVAGKKTPSDPVALVNAIAVARERGLTDVAERLEKELPGAPSRLETVANKAVEALAAGQDLQEEEVG